MSTTGLEVFDTTVQTTNRWLNEIAEDIGPDGRHAYDVLRAVLHSLRDRLTVDQAAHLGAHLPMLVRGSISRAGTRRGRHRSCKELRNIRPPDTRDGTRAVFRVINKYIDPSEVSQVREAVPQEVRRMWPDRSGTA
jgi:uncharacterized protein (DUF2267 family)